ncbi:MAG: hypothetical protein GJ680_07490 [Alteromonadaceae bacterium]|nr:hypothetical protein [Alteromonadaceae bacterium]
MSIIYRSDGEALTLLGGARRLEAQLALFGFAIVSVNGRSMKVVEDSEGRLVEALSGESLVE